MPKLKYKVDKQQFTDVFMWAGGNLAEVARQLNIPREAAVHRHKLWGLPKLRTRRSKHSFNEHYFDVIDSTEKAYWLGFLFGNCTLCRRKNRAATLLVEKRNRSHINKLIKALNGSQVPKEKAPGSCRRTIASYAVCFTSNHLVKTIDSYGRGLTKNDIFFPEISDDNLKPFVRGYLDGNSSFFKNKGRGYCLDVHGTETFLTSLKFVLNEAVGITGSAIRKPIVGRNGYSIRYSTKQIKKIFEWIYDDDGPFVRARYFKMKKELNASS